ncbi:Zona pellucida sperm-binding protein 1, partial [Calypte anna]
SLLRYRYDCGELGMQLLAHPPPGHTIRFKVLDEFGSLFDVANCSICLHWLHLGRDGAIVFSSGYEGCHVLVKEDRYVLRVQLEEVLLSGVPVASYDLNMTCPQPGDHGDNGDTSIEPQDGRGNGVQQSQADVLVPLSQPGLLHRVSQSAHTPRGPQTHSEKLHPQRVLGHPGLQPQPGLLLPGLQTPNQPGLGHHGAQTQPGLYSGLQTPNQPSWVNPGAQTQPGFHHLGVQTQNHPSRVNSGAQNHPGVYSGLQTPNHPNLVNPGAQTQPGLQHFGVQTQTQLSLGHPGAQTHPGAYSGLQTPNQPGLGHHGAQTQSGLHHLGIQTQNHPSRVNPGTQTQPGLYSGLQTPNHPNLVNLGAQTQPGLQHLGVQTPNQPSLGHPGAQTHSGLLSRVQTQTQPGRVHPGLHQLGVQTSNHPSLLHPGAQSPSGLLLAGAQPHNPSGSAPQNLQLHSQPGFHHSVLQTQTALGHPNHSQGSTHPRLQSRPGLIRPGLQAQLQPGWIPQPQTQPGLLRPALQPQPNLLQPTALFYPSGGAGTPLTREQCQVATGRMACVAPEGREGCLQAGCCYDDRDRVAPCYYGNTATVQCLLEGHMVLVVPRGVTPQPYNLDSVRLAGTQPGCHPLRVTDTFLMFRFPVTQCGTTVQVVEDQVIYENQLISTIDVQGSPRGSITRDSVYILQARCIYNSSEALALRMEVAVPPTAPPLAMLGPLGLQLRIATDESFSSYHPEGDFPLVRVLRDPIYVEVRLLQKTDPNLVLVLHHCWAAPSPSPEAQPQWPILVDGCPYLGDNYRTQLVPVGPASPQLPFPSHYQRFVISTFTFVDPPTTAVLEGEVYISCSASVCHLAQPEPCRPSCQLGVPSRARRSPGHRGTSPGHTVTSQGQIVFPKVP